MITRSFVKESIGSFIEITTRKNKIYEGLLTSFINDNLILDNSDVYINYEDIETIRSVIIHII